MSKLVRLLLALGAVIVFLFTASTGCAKPETKEAPPDDIAIVDSLAWSGISGPFADALRFCDNNLSGGEPATFEPCLKAAFTLSFNGTLSSSDLPAGYSAVHNPEQNKLELKTGTDSIVMVVVKRDNGPWTPYTDYDTYAWNPTSTYEIVVTVRDQADKYNRSGNHRGVPVPFAWSDIIPQVLKLKPKN